MRTIQTTAFILFALAAAGTSIALSDELSPEPPQPSP